MTPISKKVGMLDGLAGQYVVGSIQENLFIGGNSFSYVDYLSFADSEVKTFVFDGTACTCEQIVFNTILFSATAGPVLIDFYAGTTADSDGTLLGVSNRRATSPIVNEGVLRLNPSNITLGTRFSGDMVPANAAQGIGSSNQGAQSSQGLPFEIDFSIKYAFTITNTNGAGVYVKIDATWFEVPLV